MSDSEVVRYLYLTNDDPIVIRLLAIINGQSDDSIVPGLVSAGMDPVSQLFENTYTPSEYIHHLRNEADYAYDEAEWLRDQVDDLKSLTLVEHMENLAAKLRSTEQECGRLRRRDEHMQQKLTEMQSKLDMWGAINGDFSGIK